MFDVSDETIEELYQRLLNLQYLYKLKGLGFDVEDRLFAYCGCGQCSNEPFLAGTIMLLFDIEDENAVQFDYCDFEEWAMEKDYKIANDSITETVLEVTVPDLNADKSFIPVITENCKKLCLILKLDVLEAEAGPVWYAVVDCWNSEEESILDLFLYIRQLTSIKEVAVA